MDGQCHLGGKTLPIHFALLRMFYALPLHPDHLTQGGLRGVADFKRRLHRFLRRYGRIAGQQVERR